MHKVGFGCAASHKKNSAHVVYPGTGSEIEKGRPGFSTFVTAASNRIQFYHAHINATWPMRKIRLTDDFLANPPDTAIVKTRHSTETLARIYRMHHYYRSCAQISVEKLCLASRRVPPWKSSCASGLRGFCSSSNHRKCCTYTKFTSCSSLRCPIEAEGLQIKAMASLGARDSSGHDTSFSKKSNLPAIEPA